MSGPSSAQANAAVDDDARFEVLVQRDCLGGERAVEIRLPRGVQRGDLDRAEAVHAGEASRHVLEQLPRPFFRLDIASAFTLSGIFGEPRVRFMVRLGARERALEIALRTCRAMLSED